MPRKSLARPYEEKACAWCGNLYGPRVIPSNGRLNWSGFDRSRFCSQTCSSGNGKRFTNLDERRRNRYLLYTYGLSLDEYRCIHDHQGGMCAICGKAERHNKSGRLIPFYVDHDHASGKVRGLLHDYCNRRVVGNLTVEKAEAVLAYLKNPPAQEVVSAKVPPKPTVRRKSDGSNFSAPS